MVGTRGTYESIMSPLHKMLLRIPQGQRGLEQPKTRWLDGVEGDLWKNMVYEIEGIDVEMGQLAEIGLSIGS